MVLCCAFWSLTAPGLDLLSMNGKDQYDNFLKSPFVFNRRNKAILVWNDMKVSKWWQNVLFFVWTLSQIIIKHVWMIFHIHFRRVILQRQWVSWHLRGDVRLKLSPQSICGTTDQYGSETTMMGHYWTSPTCCIDSQLELGQTPSIGWMLCVHVPIND